MTHQSSRRHFKTLSLDESRSPDFNLFSDQEDSKGDEAETMAETIEQYMSKTRTDYGSGVVRPKIKDKDNFELKDQFLKELRTNTFSGSDNDDANKYIEKVLEVSILCTTFSNITVDPIFKPSVMLRALTYVLTGAGRNQTIQQETCRKPLYKHRGNDFKELLMKYPQHYLTENAEGWNLFYNGDWEVLLD
ncbi:hypothetical protein Tco_0751139 [Tanacetum coccineum]|uniref:Uncharacterized protein n=1 Tax=Tanacetum coccineum TaxID=301880 RepID=A0ABQ4Z374_9ASTR